jgi:starch phosphorylase
VLDGWWLEGWHEGETGWAIGNDHAPPGHEAEWAADAEALYRTLGETIAPRYAKGGAGWAKVMRGALAINGSRFNTHRMAAEYAAKAYALPAPSA